MTGAPDPGERRGRPAPEDKGSEASCRYGGHAVSARDPLSSAMGLAPQGGKVAYSPASSMGVTLACCRRLLKASRPPDWSAFHAAS
jgi:hypothetical protein